MKKKICKITRTLLQCLQTTTVYELNHCSNIESNSKKPLSGTGHRQIRKAAPADVCSTCLHTCSPQLVPTRGRKGRGKNVLSAAEVAATSPPLLGARE